MKLTSTSLSTLSTLLALLAAFWLGGCSCTVTTGDSDDADDSDDSADDARDSGSSEEPSEDSGAAPSEDSGAEPVVDAGHGEVEAAVPVEDEDGGAGDASDASAPINDASGTGDASPDTPPTLTLIGDSPFALDCGEEYDEPGAEAHDAQDGELDVEMDGGPVDTSEPGSFELTYTATDADGNSVSATRVVSVCGPGCGDSGKEPVDLRLFSAVQYEQFSQADASWEVSEDGNEVIQTVNADASIFLSDFDTTDLSIEGSWQATGSSDDDLMGFVFGYQDPGHFYLFDWKGATQTYEGELAEVGMSLKIVAFDELPEEDGKFVHEDSNDFWATEGTENVSLLTVDGETFRNDVPWDHNEEYRFFFEAHQGSFRIAVYSSEGEVLEDWSVSDDTYPGGRFGLYNFSQGPVAYSAFLARETPIECSTVDVPAMGDAGAAASDAGADAAAAE